MIMMKKSKILILIVSLLLLSGLVLLNFKKNEPNSTNTVETTNQNLLTYSNQLYGVNFNYPTIFMNSPLFSQEDTLVSEFFVTDNFEIETEGVLAGAITHGSKIEFHIFNLEPADFVTTRCSILSSFSNIQCEQTSIAGSPAAIVINTQTGIKSAFIEHKEMYYLEFNFQSSSENEFQQNIHYFDQIIESLKLL